MNNFTQEFMNSNSERNSVDENWTNIRNCLYDIMESCVPSKMTKGRRHLPWISTNLKRKMRKRNSLYKKARSTHTGDGWSKYRKYHNHVHVTKLVHNAHSDYVNTIIGGSLTKQPKRFWSYVKLMRTENLGIPTLQTATKLCRERSWGTCWMLIHLADAL